MIEVYPVGSTVDLGGTTALVDFASQFALATHFKKLQRIAHQYTQKKISLRFCRNSAKLSEIAHLTETTVTDERD